MVSSYNYWVPHQGFVLSCLLTPLALSCCFLATAWPAAAPAGCLLTPGPPHPLLGLGPRVLGLSAPPGQVAPQELTPALSTSLIIQR